MMTPDLPQPWEETARAFTAAVDEGRLDLPLPGHGRTRVRWAALAALAETDLSLARLGEGHADALAILDELDGLHGAPTVAGPSCPRWGVWAARPPGPSLAAQQRDGTWWLEGTKQYCSGARVCTHALVTADTAEGVRLFPVRASEDGARPIPGSRPAVGMAGTTPSTCASGTLRASSLPVVTSARRRHRAPAGFGHHLTTLGGTGSLAGTQ